MKFKEFQRMYSDEPAEKKLELLIEQMDNIGSARVNAKDAQWRNNIQERAFWNQEAYAMKERVNWLRTEIVSALRSNEESKSMKGA